MMIRDETDEESWKTSLIVSIGHKIKTSSIIEVPEIKSNCLLSAAFSVLSQFEPTSHQIHRHRRSERKKFTQASNCESLRAQEIDARSKHFHAQPKIEQFYRH